MSVMSGQRIEIRAAREEEIGVAAEILEDAIAWAAERGLGSWNPGDFAAPGSWGRDRLVQAASAGGLFLVWAGDLPVGTVSLLAEDPRFWPQSPPDALYLHRFAVRRSHAGNGVGGEVLRWADGEIRRRGRRFLRLDCLAGNPGIRAYYERAGFEPRGELEVEGLRFALYERAADGDRDGPMRAPGLA
jgi:GNAT superfamily N-acetyltransferase